MTTDEHKGWDDGYWYDSTLVPPVGVMVRFWHHSGRLLEGEVATLPYRADGHLIVVSEAGKEWLCWPPDLSRIG